jgi:transglutaminase-like putative cysteine protease
MLLPFARRTVLALTALAGAVALAAAEPHAGREPPSRTFVFTYRATVTGVPAAKTVRVWLPVPQSSADQEVRIVGQDLPGKHEINHEPADGNRILYVEAKPDSDGNVPLAVSYRVTRHEVSAEPGKDGDTENLEKFLRANAKVPVGGKTLKLLEGKDLPRDPMEAARALYDIVDKHMVYKKVGTGWGQGDAEWACASGYGNCTDFHSLFMSLARAQKIPVKFEIGFPLPAKGGKGDVPGYHCWAKFRVDGKGWVPVDISEANKNPKLKDYYFGHLSADRVQFSTGRDLNLVPRQRGGPLNFFIYPYVEVDGKPYPADKVQKKFTYQDVAGGTGR